MFYLCPECNKIYKEYERDIPYTEKRIAHISEEGFLSQHVEHSDTGDSITYCIKDFYHQNGSLYTPAHLNKEELVELFSLFKGNNFIHLPSCTAKELVRVNYLLGLS